jgi:isochorismate hydrolase
MSIIYVTSLFCQTPPSHRPYLTTLVIVPMENYLLRPNIYKYCVLMALKNNVNVEHLRLKCTKTLSTQRRNTINTLFDMNSQGLELLNLVNIILLPKKPDAKRITNNRPIILIHSITKLFSNLLANRLEPLLDSLVSKCQSALIKTRSIHNNFLYVRNTVRKLHKTRSRALFMKLDI